MSENISTEEYKPSQFIKRGSRVNSAMFKNFEKAYDCSRVPEKFISDPMMKQIMCDKSFPINSEIEQSRLKALNGDKNDIGTFFKSYREYLKQNSASRTRKSFNSTGGSKKRKTAKRMTRKRMNKRK